MGRGSFIAGLTSLGGAEAFSRASGIPISVSAAPADAPFAGDVDVRVLGEGLVAGLTEGLALGVVVRLGGA